MTTTLSHPTAEDLGRFAEGTLDGAQQTAVVTHIADCDECRIVVVDATEFVEPEVVHSDWRRWMGVAAALVAVVIGARAWNSHRDPLGTLIAASAELPRPVGGRLSGFPYREPSPTYRGGAKAIESPNLKIIEPAAEVIEHRGNDARTRHARGIALLFVGDPNNVAELAAAAQASNDPLYWSDLAAAQIAKGDYKKALESTDRALRTQPNLPEALFNRAAALEALGLDDQAVVGYKHYRDVDPSSPWAAEGIKRAREILERH